MTKKIKITMLGASQTGKTCYMLAMYSIMSFGVNGFSLSTTDPDDHLDLTEQWENIVSTEGKERWPPPTKEETNRTYSFNFNYALTTRLMEFDWFDYRGAALTEKGSTGSEDVPMLRSRIKDSSCLFLCIPGTVFADGISPINAVKVTAMRNLIQQDATEGKRLPIVILITKFDECKHLKREEIVDAIKINLFADLFIEGAGWPVMICPVSLGNDLKDDMDHGLIEPTGVHLPLIFAIQTSYMNMLTLKQSEEESAQSILEERKRAVTELEGRNWFVKLFDGQEKIKDANSSVKSGEKDAAKIERQRKEIEKKAELLGRELRPKDKEDKEDKEDKVYIFFDGCEI